MAIAKAYVYEITNKTNGRKYIGKARNPNGRWGSHVNAAESPLVRAMVLEGVDNFSFEIVTECANDNDALNDEERRIQTEATAGVDLYNRQLTRFPAKKGHLWNEKVYRNRRYNVWVLKFRESPESKWRLKHVPPAIQDEAAATEWAWNWLVETL